MLYVGYYEVYVEPYLEGHHYAQIDSLEGFGCGLLAVLFGMVAMKTRRDY